LPHLRTLELLNMQLVDFPAAVAGALQRLTYLNLNKNNFQKLPAAISQITTLQSIKLTQNTPLQLEEDDLNTLAALPHLQILSLSKQDPNLSDSGFSNKSVGVLMAISRRFPHLNLPL